MSEGLFNRRDLVWSAGILFGCAPWCDEAKLFFAAYNPGALRHKAVLPRNPFLDFLIGSALPGWLLLAKVARRFTASSMVITGAHSALRPD